MARSEREGTGCFKGFVGPSALPCHVPCHRESRAVDFQPATSDVTGRGDGRQRRSREVKCRTLARVGT